MNKKRLWSGVAVLLFATSILGACAPDGTKDTASSSTTESTTAETTTSTQNTSAAPVTIADGKTSDAQLPAAGTLYMRQLYTAPHGEQAFAVVNVLMKDDTILDAKVDEFQYVDKGDSWTGVPNSDKKFGENYPEGKVLIAKEENNEAYSKNMKDKAQATQTWEASMSAITNFVKGKKVDDLKKAVEDLKGQGEDGNPSDVVSGATFTDTGSYLETIVEAAENGMVSVGATGTGDDLKAGMILAAPHGEQSFAVVTVALDGDAIAATFTDEFQYVDPADFGGVPNSDKTFGEGIKDGLVLGSKYANDAAYSALMKDHAQATQTWSANTTAIEAFALGKTVAELEETVKTLQGQGDDDKVSDVVSGATFVDTAGYLEAIISAAKAAK